MRHHLLIALLLGAAAPLAAQDDMMGAQAGVSAARPAPDSLRTPERIRAYLMQVPEGTIPDLSGLRLDSLDFSGMDMRKANLTKSTLAGANFSGADLFSCDLTDAVATGANFERANLDGTTLRRADLQRANLRYASLFATIIEQTNLREADLRETRIIGYLRKADLTGARLANANIGADPGNQSMGVMRAQFVGADLTGADLSGANLFKADFSYATLVRASLAGANLSNAELVQADLTGADVTGADVTLADVNGAIFTRARGVPTLKGLAEARNREKAVF